MQCICTEFEIQKTKKAIDWLFLRVYNLVNRNLKGFKWRKIIMKTYTIYDTSILNKEELQTGRISYRRLMNHFMDNRILCNNLAHDSELNYKIFKSFVPTLAKLSPNAILSSTLRWGKSAYL